jgi:hypothetical protein
MKYFHFLDDYGSEKLGNLFKVTHLVHGISFVYKSYAL